MKLGFEQALFVFAVVVLALGEGGFEEAGGRELLGIARNDHALGAQDCREWQWVFV